MVNKREPLFPPNLDCHSAGTAESDKTKQKFFADSTEDMHNAGMKKVYMGYLFWEYGFCNNLKK